MTNEEMLKFVRQAKSADELSRLAKENNVDITKEKTQSVFDKLHMSGELADEELENVSGGCDESDVEQKYQIGDEFSFRYGGARNSIGVAGRITAASAVRKGNYISDWKYDYDVMNGGRLTGGKSTILQSNMRNII